jgi:hypothetical protein
MNECMRKMQDEDARIATCNPTASRSNEWVFNLSAAMLVLTALAKLYSAAGSARILKAQDPLLHLGYRPVMILAALLEIAAAAFLFRSRSELARSLVLLWLTANFIFYHLGDYALGIHFCPCLGQLADRLPLPRGMADDG